MHHRRRVGLAGGLAATVLTAVVTALLGAAPATATATDVIGGPLLGRPGVVVDKPAAVPAPPDAPAASWLLADLDTGTVLAAKNAHERLRPASTLKILTAVTLLPVLDKSTVYTASWDDANAEGSRVGIVPDATYTIDQLFTGMFLPSGNDAALALAHAAGGLPHTLDLMNAKARELQALDTRALTPNGLDTDGQLSSAYDLALISRAGLARADFSAYVATRSSAFPGKMPAKPGPRPTFMIYNQNRLLGHYDGALGVKTGYTTKARSTFVGAAQRGGHRLVVTIMKTGAGSWKHAAALLDWGFAHEGQLSPVGQLVDPVTATTSPTPAAVKAQPGATPAAGAVAGSSASGPPRGVLAAAAAALLGVGLVSRVGVVRRRRRYPRPARSPRG